MWLLAAYGQPTGGLTARVVWLVLRVDGHLAPFHIHRMNRVNSGSGFSHNDSTINIIIIIIIIITCSLIDCDNCCSSVVNVCSILRC